MGKKTIVWIMIAASLILAGCAFCVISTLAQYETNTYEINEAFSNISITTDTAEIVFLLSDNGKCKVVCYEEKSAKHSVTVENDVLVVRSNKSWHDYIGFNFGSQKITVYLPETEYNELSINESTGNVEMPKDFSFENVDISLSTGNIDFFAPVSKLVKLEATTGNIRIENISAESLDLSVTTGEATVSEVTCRDDITVDASTGRAYLTDISCRSIISSGTTGSISLSNVIATNKFSIERSTGDVKFSGCDADEIYVKTSTGSVTGSFLSDKIFITNTDTGSVDVPKTVTGGKCEITTHTGAIKISID